MIQDCLNDQGNHDRLLSLVAHACDPRTFFPSILVKLIIIFLGFRF